MDAIIDTGAQSTCIANEKADQLDLPVLGQTTIKGATGEIETNTYKIQSIELQRGFHFEKESIVGVSECGEHADLILGMDLIGQCLLVLSPDGTITLAF